MYHHAVPMLLCRTLLHLIKPADLKFKHRKWDVPIERVARLRPSHQVGKRHRAE
jgi:hypothetical protein